MMLILFLATELTSIVTSLALVPPSDTSDLSFKYLDGLGKQIVHFNGSPLCISKPTTADVRNRILNLLAHKMCSLTSSTPRFGTYLLHDSTNPNLETKNVYCRLKRSRFEISCDFLDNQQFCENFIEVKCKSCHQEHTVSTFNDVILRNPLYPHLAPGWACTYDISLESQHLQQKTMMELKILKLNLPPADYSVTPGRSQCVESYIQILQGWNSKSLSVLDTLCDEHDGPLFYNVTRPYVQIRFVSGNQFYPRLTGFSIIVSAHHVGYNVSQKNWKYFLPVFILVFFIIVFCIGVIYCFIVICSENRNKSRREGGSWQSSPTYPLEVRHHVSRTNRPANPITRENPYIVDNTTRPRAVAENPGTATRSLPGSARSQSSHIQQRSLPSPPISARWDTEAQTIRRQSHQLQNMSGLHASNTSSRDNSELYISVNWNDQSGIYMNRTSPSTNSINRISQPGNFMNRTSQSGNYNSMDGSNQEDNYMNRSNQIDNYMNRSNQVDNYMNRSNQLSNSMNRSNLERSNQSNQSIMSRLFRAKMYRSSPKNRDYEDISGSSGSGIYTTLNTPQVPRRPSWTFEQETLDEDRETLDGNETNQVPTPVYMAVMKSPDSILNKAIEDEYTTFNIEIEDEYTTVGAETDIIKDEAVPRDMIQAVQDEHIQARNEVYAMPQYVNTSELANDEVRYPDIAARDMIPHVNAKDESKTVCDATVDLVKDTRRTPHMSYNKDKDRDNIPQPKNTKDDLDLHEDFKTKTRNYKCVLSEMKKKVRNSYRSVSVSGGFTFWEIDQQDLLQEKDDVFDE